MNELKLCPFCGWEFAEHAWNEFGEEYRVCDQCGASSGTVDSKWDWQSRPIEDALHARIAELEGIVKADNLRLINAGLSAGLYSGCDTAEMMAEEILASRARIAELDEQVDALQKYADGAMNEIDYLEARIAKLEADKERLNSCESALISMVNQFFYSKAGENIFRHSFMSAEEEAAEYLVEHGIARWADERKSSICFNEVQE